MTIRSGCQGAQGGLVELVDRLAPLGALAHRRVDLTGAQSSGSASRVTCGSRSGRGRMVALVRHRDHLLAEIEREEQLRGVGHEAYNAHSVTVMPRRSA